MLYDSTKDIFSHRKLHCNSCARIPFPTKLFTTSSTHYNTGKERDPETSLQYFGARYLDPKTSRWISSDPAMGEYIPLAPLGENERKHNSNLPGMGGVYNVVNLHVYHYAGNNPVKYVDPDGRVTYEGDTIYCDLNDDFDMYRAFDAFNTFDNTTGQYVFNRVVATDGNGLTIEFNNRSSFDLSNNLSNIDYNGLRDALALIGTELSLGSVLAKDITPELGKKLGKLGISATVAVLLIDGKKAIDNPNIDTVSDLVITGVGLFGIEGMVISVGLTIAKKGAVKSAEFVANLNNFMKKDPIGFYEAVFNFAKRYPSK